ncbi:hypothetical protein [Hypericibacter sp.]|uniref:hypothetical protein n=1 Tax=Hypericibacter sp. TaxID=2705401 RepID=UPI003D6CA740
MKRGIIVLLGVVAIAAIAYSQRSQSNSSAGVCREIDHNGVVYLLACPAGMLDMDAEKAGKAACNRPIGEVCVAWMWTTETGRPEKWPLTDANLVSVSWAWQNKPGQLLNCDREGC